MFHLKCCFEQTNDAQNHNRICNRCTQGSEHSNKHVISIDAHTSTDRYHTCRTRAYNDTQVLSTIRKHKTMQDVFQNSTYKPKRLPAQLVDVPASVELFRHRVSIYQPPISCFPQRGSNSQNLRQFSTQTEHPISNLSTI